MKGTGLPELAGERFAETIAEETPCVVEFYARWCAPCGMMEPVLCELAEEYAGQARFYRADTDKMADVAEKYGVDTLPCVLFFLRGEAKERASGAKTKQSLKNRIERVLQEK